MISLPCPGWRGSLLPPFWGSRDCYRQRKDRTGQVGFPCFLCIPACILIFNQRFYTLYRKNSLFYCTHQVLDSSSAHYILLSKVLNYNLDVKNIVCVLLKCSQLCCRAFPPTKDQFASMSVKNSNSQDLNPCRHQSSSH